MGKELFCDICRKSVPIETALQPLMVGEDKVADLCLNCVSTLTASIKKQISDQEVLQKQHVAEANAALKKQQEVVELTSVEQPVDKPVDEPEAPKDPETGE